MEKIRRIYHGNFQLWWIVHIGNSGNLCCTRCEDEDVGRGEGSVNSKTVCCCNCPCNQNCALLCFLYLIQSASKLKPVETFTGTGKASSCGITAPLLVVDSGPDLISECPGKRSDRRRRKPGKRRTFLSSILPLERLHLAKKLALFFVPPLRSRPPELCGTNPANLLLPEGHRSSHKDVPRAVEFWYWILINELELECYRDSIGPF
jgi:hypothetical protein